MADGRLARFANKTCGDQASVLSQEPDTCVNFASGAPRAGQVAE